MKAESLEETHNCQIVEELSFKYTYSNKIYNNQIKKISQAQMIKKEDCLTPVPTLEMNWNQNMRINDGLQKKNKSPQIQKSKGYRNLPKQLNRPKIFRSNMEIWQDQEIRKIFTLYQQHGSQWKIIAYNFPQRACNSIKNRFYTVIRNLLKQLFYTHPKLPSRIPHEISSKIILRFYQGREEFQSLKNFGKTILQDMNFSIQEQKIADLCQKYSEEVKLVYNLIFEQAEPQNSDLIANKSGTSRQQHMCQQIQNNQIGVINSKNNVLHSRESREHQNYYCGYNMYQEMMPYGNNFWMIVPQQQLNSSIFINPINCWSMGEVPQYSFMDMKTFSTY